MGYIVRVEYMLVSTPPITFLDEVHHATPVSSFDETRNFYCTLGDRIDGWDFDPSDRFRNVHDLATQYRHADVMDIRFFEHVDLPLSPNGSCHRNHAYDGCTESFRSGPMGNCLPVAYHGREPVADDRLLERSAYKLAWFFRGWNHPVSTSDPLYSDAADVGSLDSQDRAIRLSKPIEGSSRCEKLEHCGLRLKDFTGSEPRLPRDPVCLCFRSEFSDLDIPNLGHVFDDPTAHWALWGIDLGGAIQSAGLSSESIA